MKVRSFTSRTLFKCLNDENFEDLDRIFQESSKSFDDICLYLSKNQLSSFLKNRQLMKKLIEKEYATEKFCTTLLQLILNSKQRSLFASLCSNIELIEHMLRNAMLFDEEKLPELLSWHMLSVKDNIYECLEDLHQHKPSSIKELCQIHSCLFHFKFLTSQQKKDLIEKIGTSQSIPFQRLIALHSNHLHSQFRTIDDLSLHLFKKERKNLLNI